VTIQADQVAAMHLGRPRDELREQAILDAAVDLLCTVGYEGFSMDTLAARAKASKATIYRRWSGKAEVVVAALRQRKCANEEIPNTGSLRDDLVEFMRCEAASSASEDVALFVGVLRAMQRDEELAKVLQEQLIFTKAAIVREIIDRSIRRGETPATVDPAFMFETVQAVMFNRLVLQSGAIDDAFIIQVVDKVALPLLRG